MALGHRAVPAQAQWAQWNTEVSPYGVGIEEEVMLIDPQRRWALAQRIDDVLHELPAPLAGRVSATVQITPVATARTIATTMAGRGLRRRKGRPCLSKAVPSVICVTTAAL